MPRSVFIFCYYLNDSPNVIRIGKTMDLAIEIKAVNKPNIDNKEYKVFYVECGNIDDYLRRFNNCMKKQFQLKDPANTRVYIVTDINVVKSMLCTVTKSKKCLSYQLPIVPTTVSASEKIE